MGDAPAAVPTRHRGLRREQEAAERMVRVAESDLQPDLFDAAPGNKRVHELDRIVDALNRKLGRNAIRFGSMGVKQGWAMRQDKRSKKFTTRWDELPVAKA